MSDMRKLIDIVKESSIIDREANINEGSADYGFSQSESEYIGDAFLEAAGVIEWGTEEEILPQDAYEGFWENASAEARFFYHEVSNSEPEDMYYVIKSATELLNEGTKVIKEILGLIQNKMGEEGATPQLQKFKEVAQNALKKCHEALDFLNYDENIEEANRNQDTTWRDEAEQEMSLDPNAPYYVGWSEQAYDEETGRPKGDAGGVYAINIDNVVDAENLVQELGAGYYYDSMKDMHPSDVSYMRHSKDKIKDYSKQAVVETNDDSKEHAYEISVSYPLNFNAKAAITTELNKHHMGIWGTDHDPETDTIVFTIQTTYEGLQKAKEIISQYTRGDMGVIKVKPMH